MKRHLLALCFLLCAFGGAAQPTPLLPAANLEQWWPFCSSTDLMDRTFTGFDLLSSNVSATTDRFGNANRAYSFNGINSELHYTTTFILPMFGIADFSYSCHIFPTVAQDAIIMYNGNPALDGLGIIMSNNTGTGPGTNIGILFGGVTTYMPAGATVTLNQWHHLCIRRNGNSYLLFIDGVFASPAHIPVGLPAAGYNTPTTVFQLGLDMTSGTRAFTGRIDDISIYGRQVSNSEVLRLRDFNPNIVITLGADTAICPGITHFLGGPTIDTTRYPNVTADPVLGYRYRWSTGDTVTNVGITHPPTPVPPAVVTLNVTRDSSCPAFSVVTIRQIIPYLNIGPRDTNLCEGESFVLNPTPATVGIIDYAWNTGSTGPSENANLNMCYSLIMDSMIIRVHPTTGLPDTTHCVVVDTTCLHLTPEIFVTLEPDFDTSCDGTPILLQDTTNTFTAPAYRWQDGSTAPTYSAPVTGTYWLEVTDGACVRSDTSKIIIVDVSVDVLSNDTAICKGASLVANATGTPGVLYQWTPTAGMSVSNIPTPVITPDTSAWYILATTIIEPTTGALLHCVSKDSFFVDVQPFPIVKMGGNRNVCEFDTIHIKPQVTPGWFTHYQYDWTPATYIDDPTAPSVVFTAGDTTKMIVTVSTSAGCEGSDSAIVYTFNGNFLSMSTDTAVCPGDSVVLLPLSTEPGITYIKWEPSTYVDYPFSADPVTIKPIGTQSYRVIGTSIYGCTDTLGYTVKVFPAAVITMADSAVLFPGDSYQIEPITNTTYYSWSPPVGLSDTSASNPLATPPVNTKYILKASTQDGCSTMDSISIRLNENSIISLPNAFAPGSFNSTLKVILKGRARLRYFRVYNRWGKLVFEGKNIDSGWDGTIDGVPQPIGVYVYEAEAITDKGKLLHKQGNVTLLR